MKRVTPILLLVALMATPVVAGSSSAQLRIGGHFPTGDGEFWDATRAAFTLSTSDLYGPIGGVTLGHFVDRNIQVGLDVSVFGATSTSAVREFSDRHGPAFHDSRLTMVPILFDVRLTSDAPRRHRGPHGQFRENVFYVYGGAGIGMNVWDYEEVRDFVDFSEKPAYVFFDRFRATGVALAAHGLAGVAIPVGPDLSVTFEGRYLWSEADPGGDFAGVGRMIFSGPSIQGGVTFHF